MSRIFTSRTRLREKITFYVIWDRVYVFGLCPNFMPGSKSWWEGPWQPHVKKPSHFLQLFLPLHISTEMPKCHVYALTCIMSKKQRPLSPKRRVAAMNCTQHPLDKSSQSVVINSGGHGRYSFWREISFLPPALRPASTQQWANTSWERAIYLRWPRGWGVCSPPTA